MIYCESEVLVYKHAVVFPSSQTIYLKKKPTTIVGYIITKKKSLITMILPKDVHFSNSSSVCVCVSCLADDAPLHCKLCGNLPLRKSHLKDCNGQVLIDLLGIVLVSWSRQHDEGDSLNTNCNWTRTFSVRLIDEILEVFVVDCAVSTETLNGWVCALKSWEKAQLMSPVEVIVHFSCTLKF